MVHDAHLDPAVAALLADPVTHGLPPGTPVRRIDTHAAAVFLAGPRAYKVKRAVRYPYLDYATLAAREAACRAELAVNRPFAGDLYRRVVAITRAADGRLALDGPGEPVEWAVEMARFDETATLDQRALRAGIDDALADALAEQVAAAHAVAPVMAAGPWRAALVRFLDQQAAAFRAAPEAIAPSDAAAFVRDMRAALARLGPLIEQRGRHGFVRRGHGDLHLANIACIDGRPVLFDAIEFDDWIAAGDVLYDLAFLVMDLVARDLPRAANRVLNRYLFVAGRAQHLAALAALPFYLALRAGVRAEVALARRAVVDGRAADAAGAEAARYVVLALRFLAPHRPRLIALGGLSGTGKSTLGKALAPAIGPPPGALHLRSDQERKRRAGIAETARLPPSAYTAGETAAVYADLCDQAHGALAAGWSVIVDAVFAHPAERADIADVARLCEVPFTGLWLEAPLAVRLARVGARADDASDADAAVVQAQEAYDLGALAWHRIAASGDAAATCAAALAHIPR